MREHRQGSGSELLEEVEVKFRMHHRSVLSNFLLQWC